MCYFLDALNASHALVTNGEFGDYFNILAKRRVQEGWGYYYYDGTKDPTPRLIATCTALLSLSRYAPFLASNECRATLQRLVHETHEKSNELDTVELAFAVLALATLASSPIERDTQGLVTSRIEELAPLLELKLNSRQHQLGEWAPYHFSVSIPSSGEITDYMYFPVDAIAALSLMKAKRFKGNMGYIKNVVEFYSSAVKAREGFTTAYRQKATVDNLWVTKLLDEFKRIDMTALEFLDLHSVNTRSIKEYGKQVLVLALMIGFTSVMAWIASSGIDAVYRALATVGAAVGGGFIERLLLAK
jgi:hypothetical protein